MVILNNGIHQTKFLISLNILFDLKRQTVITIHHECPCRIGKSHPRGWNFYQGRGLLSSNPEGEIYLSYMDLLMIDYFSPTFSEFRTSNLFNQWFRVISEQLSVFIGS